MLPNFEEKDTGNGLVSFFVWNAILHATLNEEYAMKHPNIKRQQLVLKLVEEHKKYSTVAKIMGISRQRVYQLYKEALTPNAKYMDAVAQWNHDVKIYLAEVKPSHRVFVCGHSTPNRTCPKCAARVRSWLVRHGKRIPAAIKEEKGKVNCAP